MHAGYNPNHSWGSTPHISQYTALTSPIKLTETNSRSQIQQSKGVFALTEQIKGVNTTNETLNVPTPNTVHERLRLCVRARESER